MRQAYSCLGHLNAGIIVMYHHALAVYSFVGITQLVSMKVLISFS
jgi:hypothetical protein